MMTGFDITQEHIEERLMKVGKMFRNNCKSQLEWKQILAENSLNVL